MVTDHTSIVALWTDLAFDAIRASVNDPTETTYCIHIVCTAIYDAWAALDDNARGHCVDIPTALPQTQETKAEAVSFAAATALKSLFPRRSEELDLVLFGLGYGLAPQRAKVDTPAGLGILVAQTVLDARAWPCATSQSQTRRRSLSKALHEHPGPKDWDHTHLGETRPIRPE